MFPDTQKVLIDVDGFTFQTTAANVRKGLGNNQNVNVAIISAMNSLENYIEGEEKYGRSPAIGLGGYWFGRNIHIDKVK